MAQATDASAAPAAASAPTHAVATEAAALEGDLVDPNADEHFIPLTRYALMERLAGPGMWPDHIAADADRFFRYLEYWRLQQHQAELLDVARNYEAFSPDSDLFQTREYTPEERAEMKSSILAGVDKLLTQANYTRVDSSRVALFMTKESFYGLDLAVDFDAFEDLIVYYRGRSVKREQRRVLSRFFRRQEFDVPIFRRVFVLFKLKSKEQRIEEQIQRHQYTRKEAERVVRKQFATLPVQVSPDNIYMKMFKNMPRTDIEMIFPNTQVRFRSIDKIKLGVTSGGAIGMGVVGTAGKLLAGTGTTLSFSALGGAVVALGGVAFRQTMAFLNQRQRYMVIMARNLYFHAMADNRGVLTKLAERAAEEDLKEEVLLYSVLAKSTVKEHELKSVDKAIEDWLASTFGLQVDFDVSDALERLVRDGIVERLPDGTLYALPPAEALRKIDEMWDLILDRLPPINRIRGHEVGPTSRLNGTGDHA